jgi:23S rRNA U2552 (ribose-2'-O)-methylase RlmE/FtsJ
MEILFTYSSNKVCDDENLKLKNKIELKNTIELKNILNTAKNKLEVHKNKFGSKLLAKLLSAFDPFRHEKNTLSKYIENNNITVAWLKCYEIISKFNLIDIDKDKYSEFRHFDNASLPGSFILATHHFITTNYPNVVYNWNASSFIPDLNLSAETDNLTENFGGLLGDTYELIKNYPQRWTMNKNNNGDTTNMNTMINLSSFKKVNLFTSDLGFNVGDDFLNQESLHMKANLGQILMCLFLLKKGGNCIIKHYTCLEPLTLSYLSMFGKLFNKCYFYKPISSKQLNSEIYIVGVDFMKNNAMEQIEQYICYYKLKDYLLSRMLYFDELANKDISIDFDSEFYNGLKKLINYQINRINAVDKVLCEVSHQQRWGYNVNNMINQIVCKNKDYADYCAEIFYDICEFQKMPKKKKLNFKIIYN